MQLKFKFEKKLILRQDSVHREALQENKWKRRRVKIAQNNSYVQAYLTPSCWKGINALTSLKSTEFKLISLVDISFRVPGVVLRNVDVTALGNPSTITCADND